MMMMMTMIYPEGGSGAQEKVAAHVFSFMAHGEVKEFKKKSRDGQVEALGANKLKKSGDKWQRIVQYEQALYQGQ
eukprot:5556021-Karenia_brevis.AAC.1